MRYEEPIDYLDVRLVDLIEHLLYDTALWHDLLRSQKPDESPYHKKAELQRPSRAKLISFLRWISVLEVAH